MGQCTCLEKSNVIVPTTTTTITTTQQKTLLTIQTHTRTHTKINNIDDNNKGHDICDIIVQKKPQIINENNLINSSDNDNDNDNDKENDNDNDNEKKIEYKMDDINMKNKNINVNEENETMEKKKMNVEKEKKNNDVIEGITKQEKENEKKKMSNEEDEEGEKEKKKKEVKEEKGGEVKEIEYKINIKNDDDEEENNEKGKVQGVNNYLKILSDKMKRSKSESVAMVHKINERREQQERERERENVAMCNQNGVSKYVRKVVDRKYSLSPGDRPGESFLDKLRRGEFRTPTRSDWKKSGELNTFKQEQDDEDDFKLKVKARRRLRSKSISPIGSMFLEMKTIGGFTESRNVSQSFDKNGNKLITSLGKGGTKRNCYCIVETIAQGSEGIVKRCQNIHTQKDYAVKIIDKGSVIRAAQRSFGKFHNRYDPILQVRMEIAILKKLQHENVVKIIEVMDDPKMNKLYIVFEYIDGGNLCDMDSHGNLIGKVFSEKDAKFYFKQLMEGIYYIHSHKVVHRDIKPSNILITKDRKRLVLADFGLSQVFHGENDTFTDSKGTPAFLPPESCVLQKSVSGRSHDIWAAGVTLFVMLFGKIPFKPKKRLSGFAEIVAIYNCIREDPVTFPPSVNECSPELINFVLRILEKKAKKRITLPQIFEHPWLTDKKLDKKIVKRDRRKSVKISLAEMENALEERPNFRFIDIFKRLTPTRTKSNLEPTLNHKLT